MPNANRTIYFDMDGVLAIWNDASIEEVATKGYFFQREPDCVAVEAVKLLIRSGFQVRILTSVFNDAHSKQDKLAWLQKYLPELKKEDVFFSTYGQPKALPGAGVNDILVDDHTPNLLSWDGMPVKYLNGINGKRGRFKGILVSNKSDAYTLAWTLASLASFDGYIAQNG